MQFALPADFERIANCGMDRLDLAFGPAIQQEGIVLITKEGNTKFIEINFVLSVPLRVPSFSQKKGSPLYKIQKKNQSDGQNRKSKCMGAQKSTSFRACLPTNFLPSAWSHIWMASLLSSAIFSACFCVNII